MKVNALTKQRRFTREFEDEAVRLVTTSGRTRREVEDNLGVGLSTLVRWISRRRDRLAEIPGEAPQADMAVELKRLRRENEILRQDRDILKRATAFFASQSGYFAWKNRPASRRQRDDMVMLAQVRSALALSNGTYVQPTHDTRVAG